MTRWRMTRWRMRALLGASAAALLIAFVPFRNGALHEFGVLKRIAEERAALLKAAGLSTDALPRSLVGPGREASADASSPSQANSPSQAKPEIDASSMPSLEIPIPPQSPTAAPESPAAASQAASGQAATPATIPISPAALAYRKGDAAALTALANAAIDPDERLALEWAALRTDPHPPEAALAE